jgi:hypothetical protein
MGWFRGQKRLGAWLALIALTLQLGLSFGHVHVEAAGHGAELATGGAEPPHDDGHPEHGDGGDRRHCPSCAILSLLAGAQIGADLIWSVPVSRVARQLTPAAETTGLENARSAFRARAPPSA